VERSIGQRRGELLEQPGASRVSDAVSLDTRLVAHGLDDAALSEAGLPHHDHVVSPPHEITCRQLLDAPPVDPLGVEFPVEPLQSRQLPETRLANASLQRALKPGFGRAGQQPVQEFQMAERFLLGRGERRIERLGGQRNAQRS